MSNTTPDLSTASQESWLKRYYFGRAAFSVLWVAAAFAAGIKNPMIAGLLLLVYPAWDAAANALDAARSGGLARNASQRLNMWLSAVAAVAVGIAWQSGMPAVIAVIGIWAMVSGLLQLATAVRRWKTHGAQWVMILSGAQSALAGGLFVVQSRLETPPSIANIAGYAAVGAFYFLLSGLWLTVKDFRRSKQVMPIGIGPQAKGGQAR